MPQVEAGRAENGRRLEVMSTAFADAARIPGDSRPMATTYRRRFNGAIRRPRHEASLLCATIPMHRLGPSHTGPHGTSNQSNVSWQKRSRPARRFDKAPTTSANLDTVDLSRLRASHIAIDSESARSMRAPTCARAPREQSSIGRSRGT